MANNATFVVTGKVRLSYVHLFKPYTNPNGGEPKYSATILLPKSDVATKQRIDAAIQAAVQAGINSKWNGVLPPIVANPVYDGDGTRPSDGTPFNEECRGHWVFTASGKQPPQVVDMALNPIISQTEVYSGIYARVSLNFFPYNSNGKKGIGCGLGNVQKLEDGEPLGGRTSAADDFGDGTQVQYPQSQPYAQAPVQQYQTTPAQQVNPITGLPAGGIMGI